MVPSGDQVIPAERRDYVRAIQAAPDAETKIARYAAAITAIAPRMALVLGVTGTRLDTCITPCSSWSSATRRSSRATWTAGDRRVPARLRRAYLNRLGRQQALDDAAACIGWLNSQPPVERIAMIGFSAGGHLSYLAACRLPVSRTAVLYGGWLPATDIPMSQPSPTLDLAPGIRDRILYLVGEDDALIDAGQRREIRDALQAAGTDHEMISYPGTAHAFFWSGTPAFNQAARDDAWSRILAMLAN